MNSLSVGAEHNIFNPNSLTFDERQKQLEAEKEAKNKAEDDAKRSPFKHFIQHNKDAYKAEDWLMAKSQIAYRIFRFLINNMDHYNAVICSYKVLQESFKISQDTIRRAIKLLKEKKYIDVYKTGTSNVYAVNKNIVWNSWGTNYEYASFGANIILSATEQEICIQAKIKAMKHREITTVKKEGSEKEEDET